MAQPGYHKQLQSNHRNLEVKRAGKSHQCAGVAIERGSRPGTLQDVWMFGRSKRCSTTIRQGQLYVANAILPPRISSHLRDFGGWLPLCLHCAVDTYSEYFEGPDKMKYLQPMSPGQRQKVIDGLQRLGRETAEMKAT